jgi:5'-deoxynucleotidase YfbR-like HD superfamily hydrolase
VKLAQLYDTGRTKRFHTTADYSGAPLQSVGEHSWGVAIFCLEIAKRLGGTASAELLKTALLHDAEEHLTGDLPAPTKWRFPELANAMRKAEAVVREELGIEAHKLTEQEQQVLKWADALELYMYAFRRVRDGARTYREIIDNIAAHMRMNLPQWPATLEIKYEIEREHA